MKSQLVQAAAMLPAMCRRVQHSAAVNAVLGITRGKDLL